MMEASLRLLLLVASGLALPSIGCECGFTINDPTSNGIAWYFTEALETDFTTETDTSLNTTWVRQGFTVSAEDGRGKYGKAFMPRNVRARPASGDKEDSNRKDYGLELVVSSSIVEGAIMSAELDSARLGLHYGSYRAGMKVPVVQGTCAAFFWYFNNTQEIDMEFLSREFDPKNAIYPLNLVIQSKESEQAGYDAGKTGTYEKVNLPFDPTTSFHEYRFDYLPGRVLFYADSVLLAEMQGDGVPSVGGHLILQHWSNGNSLWSGGPPAEDALMKVSYVKAYFNSSDHLSETRRECDAVKASDETWCAVPDMTAADASTGGHFLTAQREQPSSDPDESSKDGEGNRMLSKQDRFLSFIAIALSALFVGYY